VNALGRVSLESRHRALEARMPACRFQIQRTTLIGVRRVGGEETLRGTSDRNESPSSGLGDNYRSRVSKSPCAPWRHQIIRLIRGTLVIIYSSVATLADPVGDRWCSRQCFRTL
jgi:hypothetical protein